VTGTWRVHDEAMKAARAPYSKMIAAGGGFYWLKAKFSPINEALERSGNAKNLEICRYFYNFVDISTNSRNSEGILA
jgi:hypothetical protein